MAKKEIIQIYELFRNINKTVNKKIGCKMELMKFNPSILSIMIQLMNGEKKSLKEISSSAGLANSTASEIIDKLEEEGLVIRERDKEDKRRVLISATDKALNYRKEFEMKHLGVLEGILNGVSDEDLNIILNGLIKLNEVIKEMS